jgi:hypothetical protein
MSQQAPPKPALHWQNPLLQIPFPVQLLQQSFCAVGVMGLGLEGKTEETDTGTGPALLPEFVGVCVGVSDVDGVGEYDAPIDREGVELTLKDIEGEGVEEEVTVGRVTTFSEQSKPSAPSTQWQTSTWHVPRPEHLLGQKHSMRSHFEPE